MEQEPKLDNSAFEQAFEAMEAAKQEWEVAEAAFQAARAAFDAASQKQEGLKAMLNKSFEAFEKYIDAIKAIPPTNG